MVRDESEASASPDTQSRDNSPVPVDGNGEFRIFRFSTTRGRAHIWKLAMIKAGRILGRDDPGAQVAQILRTLLRSYQKAAHDSATRPARWLDTANIARLTGTATHGRQGPGSGQTRAPNTPCTHATLKEEAGRNAAAGNRLAGREPDGGGADEGSQGEVARIKAGPTPYSFTPALPPLPNTPNYQNQQEQSRPQVTVGRRSGAPSPETPKGGSHDVSL